MGIFSFVKWLVAALFASGVLAAESAHFEKSPVKLIDTGLDNIEVHPGPRAAVWINNRLLAASAAMEKSTHDPQRIGQTLIYDLSTSKRHELMRYAHPVCWDAHSGHATLVLYPKASDPKVTKYLFGRQVQKVVSLRLDSDANVLSQQEITPGEWNNISCEALMPIPPNMANRSLRHLRPEHGYLDLGQKGKTSEEPAVFLRSDGQKIKLSLQGAEIDNIQYLDFLGQYQLNSGSSCLHPGKKCPPDIHLMSPSGEVSTISIPSKVRDLINLTRVFVVADGLMFHSHSPTRPEGYFLLRNGVMHQLWKPRFSLNSSWAEGRRRSEYWGFETFSPDGCKVAFLRGVRPGRVHVFDHCSVGR